MGDNSGAPYYLRSVNVIRQICLWDFFCKH